LSLLELTCKHKFCRIVQKEGSSNSALSVFCCHLITNQISAINYVLTLLYIIRLIKDEKRRDTMDIITVRAFFMWCSIINGALLILSFLICAFAGDLVYRTHSKLFPVSREAFNVAAYSFIGLYKIFFWVFNLVPYIACAIVG